MQEQPSLENLWTVASLSPRSEAAVTTLTATSGVPRMIARLLVSRGVEDPVAAEAFLRPRLASLPDPFEIKGLEEGARLFADAVAQGEPVVVFGDYDVDGVTSTTLVLSFLRQLGQHGSFFIPHRIHDGYGLSEPAVARFLDEGIRFFVTVDNGVGETVLIEKMRARGARVIVIDHHEISGNPPVLPNANAIINPQRADCGFADATLAACGLTFYFLSGVRRVLLERNWFAEQGIDAPDMRDALDLVALGTVADVVRLQGVNRTLARQGLTRMRARKRPGLSRLIEIARVRTRKIDASHIAFNLAPRLNAAGRVDSADAGVHLLLAEEEAEATQLAGRLDALNRERQKIEREATKEAIALIEADPSRHLSGGALAVAAPNWHLGVVGIMASRLARRFGVPALVLGGDGDSYRGSGRSVGGFNLTEALEPARGQLLSLGGHAFACGLSVSREGFEAFADWFRDRTRAVLAREVGARPERVADLDVGLEEILDPGFLAAYEELWPFGEGNAKPIFLARHVEIRERLFQSAKGAMERYEVRQSEARTTMTVFSADRRKGLGIGEFDLAFRLDLFEVRGIPSVGLSLVDFGAAGSLESTVASAPVA